MNLTDNTVLVTGGGSGIGRGLAVALHRAGNRVIVAGRRTAPLRAVAEAHRGIEWLTLDQSDDAEVTRFAERVVAAYPELNVLVNNAGVMGLQDVAAMDHELTKAIVATNLTGPMQLTSLLLPTLLAQPRGAVVNVTSALGFVPMAAAPTYCATKAAMHSYTESLRFQLRDSAVQVIELPPPRVETDMPGPAPDAYTLSLDDFVAETMTLLDRRPDAAEVVVGAARAIRYAARNGDYDGRFAAVNSTNTQL
jgi:uncharacterized oxidoreductase